MYKVIYNDVLIDLMEEIKYARYLTKAGHAVVTDRTSANCIFGSDGITLYHVKGFPFPTGKTLKTVTITKISEIEYKKLQEEFNLNSTSIVDRGVINLKQKKVKECRELCNKRILEGIRVWLSDGKEHHFELTLEDQLNLLEIRYLLNTGMDSFIYHETGGICKEFSKEDMIKIIDASFIHKQNELQYFNKLKAYINSLNNITEICNCNYGMQLKD